MTKDKALEELFLAKKPHFDDHDTFMANLTKRLDAVEFIHQHQEATIRRYKMAMIATFVIGIISGTITMAFILSMPADVPLFNFHVHTGFLLWFTEISRPVVATALALLMTIGSISVIINIQDINTIMKMNKKTLITMMLALVTMTGWGQEIKMNEATIVAIAVPIVVAILSAVISGFASYFLAVRQFHLLDVNNETTLLVGKHTLMQSCANTCRYLRTFGNGNLTRFQFHIISCHHLYHLTLFQNISIDAFCCNNGYIGTCRQQLPLLSLSLKNTCH